MMVSADAPDVERRISAALESGATRLDLGGLNLRSVPGTVALCCDIKDLNLAGNWLTADTLERAVSIDVTGSSPSRTQLLAVIRADFERIHPDLPKLAPVASVPLPEESSITVPYKELCVLDANSIKSVPRVIGESM